MPFALYVPTSFPDRLGELWWLTLEAVIARKSRVALVDERRGPPLRLRHAREDKYELYEHIYWWLRGLETEDELRARRARPCARATASMSRRSATTCA